MLGRLDTSERSVPIVGAGVSGLLLAEELDRQGWKVTLLEARARAGGLVSTCKTEQGLSESAAHSLLASKPVRELFDRLGVGLVPVRAGSRDRFIWRGG